MKVFEFIPTPEEGNKVQRISGKIALFYDNYKGRIE